MRGRIFVALVGLSATLASAPITAAGAQSAPITAQTLIDRAEISDLLTRYYWNFGDSSAESFGKYYTDDAEFVLGARTVKGIEAIKGVYAAVPTDTPQRKSFSFNVLIGNPMITVHGNTATARLVFTEIVIEKNARYSVELEDSEGLRNPDPGSYSIVALTDRAPEVKLQTPARTEVDLAPGGSLSIQARATDDFGVVAINLARFRHRDFGRRIGDLLDDGLHREQLDLPVLRVEFCLQLFAALVELARRGEHGFFHRLDDHIRLDAFFLRECFDCLL